MTQDKAYKMTPANADNPTATFTPIESKPDKFIRLAEQRTNKAINQIHALGDLSNTAIYDYTPEQVVKIKTAITNALQLAVDRLNGLEPKQFKL